MENTFTQEQFKAAKLITAKQYLALESPIFEGQTRMDGNGAVKLYWSYKGELFYTISFTVWN